MRKALFAALLLCSAVSFAQTTTPTVNATNPANGPADIAGQLYAANFGHWTLPPGDSGGFFWTNWQRCFVTSGGVTFPAFATNAPVTIVDVNPALTETVTPTSANYGSWGCSVGLPAVNAHKNFYLKSGTAGLQESLNWASGTNAVVLITPDWTALGGTQAMINASVIGANTAIQDERSAKLSTAPVCKSSASPAVCGSSTAGFVAVPTGTNPTLVVSTTAVTANSLIFLTPDETLGTALGITCNTTLTTQGPFIVTSRTAGTSFTITANATIGTNAACLNYVIIN